MSKFRDNELILPAVFIVKDSLVRNYVSRIIKLTNTNKIDLDNR